jgi:hypothetical protein
VAGYCKHCLTLEHFLNSSNLSYISLLLEVNITLMFNTKIFKPEAVYLWFIFTPRTINQFTEYTEGFKNLFLALENLKLLIILLDIPKRSR